MSAMRKYGEVYHYKAPAEMPHSGDLWLMAVTEKEGLLLAAVVPSGATFDFSELLYGIDTRWSWEKFHSLDTCYFTCP